LCFALSGEEPAREIQSTVLSSYEKAYALLDKGNLREALPHLEAAYAGGLRHAGVVMPLARARFAAGQEERAVALLDESVRGDSSPNLLLEAGKILFERALYRQALAHLEKSWESRPELYETGMYLALSHFMLEAYAKSGEVLTALAAADVPKPAEYHILLGSVYARLGRWEDSERELKKAIAIAPDRPDGYLNLGLLALERGDEARAMALFDRGIEGMRPGTKIFYTLRSRTNCRDLSLPPDTARADTRRGEVYSRFARALQDMQHWQSALEVYLLALRLDPSRAEAYGGTGLLCQELGTPEVGKAFLQKGLEYHGKSAELHYYLGSVCAAMGEWENALGSYRQAIRLSEPTVPARYRVRLGIAELALLNEDDAEASFQQAIATDPGYATAYVELGKLYLRRKNFAGAERHLERAIELDPLTAEAYYSCGLAYIRNGKERRGRELLEVYRQRKALRDLTLNR
jgi:tetratricopeptide (TPR) repeat protein